VRRNGDEGPEDCSGRGVARYSAPSRRFAKGKPLRLLRVLVRRLGRGDTVSRRLQGALQNHRLLTDDLLRGIHESGCDFHRCCLELGIGRDPKSESLNGYGQLIEGFLQLRRGLDLERIVTLDRALFGSGGFRRWLLGPGGRRRRETCDQTKKKCKAFHDLIKYKNWQSIGTVTLIHHTRNKGFPAKYFNKLANKKS
jgi:hypothetical protein